MNALPTARFSLPVRRPVPPRVPWPSRPPARSQAPGPRHPAGDLRGRLREVACRDRRDSAAVNSAPRRFRTASREARSRATSSGSMQIIGTSRETWRQRSPWESFPFVPLREECPRPKACDGGAREPRGVPSYPLSPRHDVDMLELSENRAHRPVAPSITFERNHHFAGSTLNRDLEEVGSAGARACLLDQRTGIGLCERSERANHRLTLTSRETRKEGRRCEDLRLVTGSYAR